MKTKIAKGITTLILSIGAGFGIARAAGIALNGAGASFPNPLYSKWFDVYEKKTGAKINYQSIGSGGGIQQLKAKTVDFGASDAPLSDKEVTEMPGPVVHIPTVAGAEALIYNVPGIAQGLKLDAATVAGIYLGEIRSWNNSKIAALNSGTKLPSVPIAVAHRSDSSGTTFIFTDYLSNVSATWKSKVGTGKAVNWPVGIGGKGNGGVAGVVKQMPGGIGYVELAYAIQNKANYAALKNKSGNFVLPSTKGATAAAAGGVNAMNKDVRVSVVDSAGKDAYPITGFTYILAYTKQSDATKSKTLTEFLNWAIHDGQKFADDLHYASLPKAYDDWHAQAWAGALTLMTLIFLISHTLCHAGQVAHGEMKAA